MINILVADPFVEEVDPSTLEQAAQAVLRQEAPETESDLSVAVEDDEQLKELNLTFLGIDAPTDVLSFPSGEEEADPETGRRYLGDVVVSYPRALEQAGAAGHPVQNEIQLLVVHGVLHLLGFDHAEEEEKARMWTAQSKVLRDLGVHIARLPE